MSSGFIAVPPVKQQVEPAQDTVVNDGWFPDISLRSVRELVRLDGTVTDARLREAIRYALIYVNRSLERWQAAQRVAGITRLADVAEATLDNQDRHELLYRRAVASTAKADLIERYRDQDSTDSGLRRAEELDAAIGEQRRNATWAVRDIQGLPHTVVELI